MNTYGPVGRIRKRNPPTRGAMRGVYHRAGPRPDPVAIAPYTGPHLRLIPPAEAPSLPSPACGGNQGAQYRDFISAGVMSTMIQDSLCWYVSP